eukprot:CAMPEP_0171166104 /NCGR_PEP_ID=MMETSP0790-20130122/6523_1 /TAXON_ID=2925 /ORGANISM="Alexandrium catenella, Strain OF101" /LENGTH=92 /DNA_ID=CAMNT_0011630903 /DNA_START=47 /DNA_END=325 /DNA_ORIENTATION=+
MPEEGSTLKPPGGPRNTPPLTETTLNSGHREAAVPDGFCSNIAQLALHAGETRTTAAMQQSLNNMRALPAARIHKQHGFLCGNQTEKSNQPG